MTPGEKRLLLDALNALAKTIAEVRCSCTSDEYHEVEFWTLERSLDRLEAVLLRDDLT